MKHFAERCAASLRSRTAATIVLGNEAGDMDSVVGSFYLSYLLTALAERSIMQYQAPICPLINFPRSDLGLRNDVLKTLDRAAQIDPSLIFSCVPDLEGERDGYVPIAASQSDADPQTLNAAVVLFDHNKLASWQEKALASRVVGIVDHHADESLYGSAMELRIVAPAGSACTHLVHLFLRYGIPIPNPQLLLAPIVLDTMNFDPSLKKTTPLDEAARDHLLGLEGALPSSAKTLTDLFNELVALKFDVTGLTIPQNLRRDYKRFDINVSSAADNGGHRSLSIGISSVLLLRSQVAAIYSEERWIAEVEAYRQKQQCDAIFIMFCAEAQDSSSSINRGQMIRQLAVLGSEAVVDAMRQFAAEHPSIGLAEVPAACRALHAVDGPQEVRYVDFDQADYATSRKALTPLLADFFQRRNHAKI